MASRYTATDAAAYERLMGRWSGRLADELIAFAGIEPPGRAGLRLVMPGDKRGGRNVRDVVSIHVE